MTRVTRRFNYTHRVRIPASKVAFDVEQMANGRWQAIVRELRLEGHGTHAEDAWNAAKVIVEARRLSSGSYCRQSIGSVADVRSSTTPFRFELPDFGGDSDITFRVKVVDAAKRLMGEVDGVRAGQQHPTNHDPLIDLVGADLGEEAWRLDWNDPDGPRVLVNKRLANWSGLLTRDPLIRSIVLPQIVRQVLQRAIEAEVGSGDWIDKWLRLAERLGHEDPPEEDEDGRWVDGVVSSFCDGFALVTNADQHVRSVEEVL